MTPTLWLLAALIGILAALLAGYIIALCYDEAKDALDYRSINVGTMEGDVRKLQARVPDAPPRRRRRAGLVRIVTHDTPGETVTEWHEPRGPGA